MWFNKKIAQEDNEIEVLIKENESLKTFINQGTQKYVSYFNDLEVSKRRMELALMVTESYGEEGLTATSKIDDDVIAVANNVLRNELEMISRLQKLEIPTTIK
jgi:hypothetical protein